MNVYKVKNHEPSILPAGEWKGQRMVDIGECATNLPGYEQAIVF